MPSHSEALREDRELSPYTGYTRRHWLAIVERLVAGVLPCVDRETGIPHLARDEGETALPKLLRNPGGLDEAFDRTHLLMAVYIAATGRTTIDGYDGDIADLYRRGMRTFHSADNPHFNWRRGAAATTLAILLREPEFLDGLDDDLKADLGRHLAQFIHRPTRDCNTLLFSMMPACVLDRLGADYDRAMLDDYFDRVLSLYRGDGWFIDGWNRGFDHYDFWGFQLYLHALMTYDERWRGRYAERVREITAAHERTLPYWFGRDGGPIPKGRSLNYRFAAVSGVAYSQLSGLSSMDPGLARRMASGCLRYFWEHGCLTDRGLLEVGYRGPNAAVGEDYSDTGAPYWASTGLVALALPAEHPFWTAPERPIAADEAGVRRCCIRGARMILKADGNRGEARALVVGEPFLHRRVWQAGSKYYQHAYSSALGYALTGEGGPELAAGRTGLSADGRTWAYRTWPRARAIDERRAVSEWDGWPALEGLTGSVVTVSHLLDRGEVHVFWHTADEPRYLTVGGWAVQLAHGEAPIVESAGGRLVVASEAMWSVMEVLELYGAAGELTAEEVRPREGFRHSHLFGGWAAYPRWISSAPLPPGAKIAVFVDAARKADASEPTSAPADGWDCAGDADSP
ncbi:MAG TPA: DUF2264 domain-containing protein [Phycisphaerae bacterium]|nr:DUF2264 domain-containing protein [Phycisphaerae bacterium]